MITTRPVLLTVALLATAGCTSTSVSGQPATSTATTSTSTAAKSTEASTATATAMPLNNVEACSLLNPATLPAAWQPLTVDPHPLLRLGDSNCFIVKSGTGLGVAITVYRGPGRGIDSLSETAASTPVPIKIGGRSARIYRDTGGHTCGILFDFGPDQGLAVNGSGESKSAQDPCDIVTIAATAMVPNLPPS